MIKYNIFVLALHLVLIISVKASDATNPFTVANAQASYLDIIKIKPPEIFDKHKKLDFISVSKELKNEVSTYAKKNTIPNKKWKNYA